MFIFQKEIIVFISFFTFYYCENINKIYDKKIVMQEIVIDIFFNCFKIFIIEFTNF